MLPNLFLMQDTHTCTHTHIHTQIYIYIYIYPYILTTFHTVTKLTYTWWCMFTCSLRKSVWENGELYTTTEHPSLNRSQPILAISTWSVHVGFLYGSVSTWMGDHQGLRLGAVNLGPFVGVDLNLWPAVYIAIIVLTRAGNKSNQTNLWKCV